MRQTLFEIVAVRGSQVLGDKDLVDARQFFLIRAVVVKSIDIADRKKEVVVDTILPADLLHRLLAKSQMHPKTRQHENQVVVRRYHVGHLHPAGKKSSIAHCINLL